MKKKTLVASLLGVTALVAAFAVTTTAPAQAEAKNVDQVAFTMKAGASLRLTDETGIRFTAELSSADYTALTEYYDAVEFGTFIMPAAYATLKGEFSEDNFFGASAIYTWEGKEEAQGTVRVLQMDAAIDTSAATYVVNGSIVDVYAQNLGLPFAGVCYVKGTTADGDVEIRIADANADGDRAVVEVAQNAIASGNYADDEDTLTGIIDNYIAWYETKNGAKPTADYTVNVYYNDVKVDTVETSGVLNSEVTFTAPEEGLVAVTDKGATSGVVLYDGSLVLDAYYTAELTAPTVKYTKNDAGKFVVTWDEVEGQSYEVYVNDAKVTDGVVDNTYTTENGGFVVVKAVKENWAAAETEIWMDPSYLTTKGENRIYLSDFNDENSVNLWENAGRKPWGQPAYDTADISYGSKTCAYIGQAEGTSGSAQGTVYGVSVANNGTDYASGRYTLPEALDLRKVDTIYVKAVTGAWGYAPNTFFYFENGTNAYKALPFATFVREADYQNENGTLYTHTGETWDQGNFYAVNIMFDVQAMLADADFAAAFGGYTLTSIVAGASAGKTILYDEIYYSELALDEPVVSYTRNAEGKIVVSWNEVENVVSYDVKVNGEAYTGYNGGTSFIFEETAGATVTVQAIGAESVKPSTTASVYVDASYLSARTEGGVYLSTFNSTDDYKTWTAPDPGSYKARSWFTPGSYLPTAVGQATNSTSGAAITGVQFTVGVNDGLSKYNLPNTLDLTAVKEIVIVIDSNNEDMQYNTYSVGLSVGNTKYNATALTSVLKYGTETAEALTGSYCQIKNSRRWSFIINVEANLAALQSALGGNVIDGILLTSGSSGNTTFVDEIYYTTVATTAE